MPDRLYYSIKEVAAAVGIEPSVLRFWETRFPQLCPKTTRGNVRQYTADDFETVKKIHNLVRVRGFRIEAARRMMTAERGAVDKRAKVLETLIGVRDELTAIKKELEGL